MQLIQSPKVLLVESQMIIAADVSLQLSKLGYEVIGINICSADALKTIESNRPDIVLMNIQSKGVEERIEAASIILKNFHIPIVFLSAHTGKEIFEQVINTQAYAFITKPFETEDLQRGLQTALDRINTEGLW
jgi:AmiR/NasT family two-component response regulator